MFVSHTKHTQQKINGFTLFAIDNMHYVNFRIQEQESVPWCGEFQNEDYNHLGTLLIFTPIPLMPKKCGLSISYMNLFKGELESVQHSHTNHFVSLSKILYVFLLITDYLIGLAFLVFLIGL